MPRFVMIVLILCLLPLAPASAEDTAGLSGLGLELGMMKLTGGELDYSNMDQSFALKWTRGLDRNTSLTLALRYGWVRPGVDTPGEDAGYTTESGAGLYTVIWQPTIGLKYHVAPDGPISPFLGAGFGLISWKVKDLRQKDGAGLFPDGPVASGFDEDGRPQDLQKNTPTAHASAGFDIFASPSLAFNLGARYHFLIDNNLDNVGMSAIQGWGPENVDVNSGLLEGFLGMTVYFGSVDDDGDGIRDNEDACPRSAEDFDGYEDTDGCPDPDNDGDGVTDDADDCPDDPEDRDGFDDDDGCPEPDNDGDRINDSVDNCPDEAEDMDGFEDGDGCPDKDNDGDGVLDEADECADTPTGVIVNEKGCAAVEEIKADMILEGVNFHSGSARLTGTSSAVLRQVAHSLQAYPDARIEVRGHTDSFGPSEANRDLSHRRAMAVRQALIQEGISPSRITAIGYGEDYPIAPNNSADGRAQNRRVEIHRTDR